MRKNQRRESAGRRERESVERCRCACERGHAEWFSFPSFPLFPPFDHLLRHTSSYNLDVWTEPFETNPTTHSTLWRRSVWLMMLPPSFFPSLPPHPPLSTSFKRITCWFSFEPMYVDVGNEWNLFSGHLASACPKAGTPTCYNVGLLGSIFCSTSSLTAICFLTHSAT